MADDLNQQIGRLQAQVERLHADSTEIKAEIKKISDQVNRWRGAGAILLIIGAVFGFFIDVLYRVMGR